jgi:hypothetical protein
MNRRGFLLEEIVRQVIFSNQKTIRDVSKRVPVTQGTGLGQGAKGFTSIPDGQEEVTYNVELDMRAVESMAKVAARSKGQKSQDGPLRVIVVTRRKL